MLSADLLEEVGVHPPMIPYRITTQNIYVIYVV